MRQRQTEKIRGSRQVEKDANHFCLSLYLSHHQDFGENTAVTTHLNETFGFVLF